MKFFSSALQVLTVVTVYTPAEYSQCQLAISHNALVSLSLILLDGATAHQRQTEPRAEFEDYLPCPEPRSPFGGGLW